MSLLPKLSLMTAVVASAAFLLFSSAGAAGPTTRTRSGHRTLHVSVDVSATPEMKWWASQARKLVFQWYPIISNRLSTPGFTPPSRIKLVFKKSVQTRESPGRVAFAQGATITFSANWIRQHPDDWGLVIHELTHVVQAYSGRQPSWLVEGIADYVRYYRYEPDKKLTHRIPRQRGGYREGYSTSARFLVWIQNTYDRAIIRRLNTAMRRSRYGDGLFQTYTGKSLDRLWDEYLHWLAKREKASR